MKIRKMASLLLAVTISVSSAPMGNLTAYAAESQSELSEESGNVTPETEGSGEDTGDDSGRNNLENIADISSEGDKNKNAGESADTASENDSGSTQVDNTENTGEDADKAAGDNSGSAQDGNPENTGDDADKAAEDNSGSDDGKTENAGTDADIENEDVTSEIIADEEMIVEETEENATLSVEDEALPEVTLTEESVTVMYGESGDNIGGALDKIFKPVYVVDGGKFVPDSDGKVTESGNEFTTSYKFVTGDEDIDISAEAFDAIKSEDLSEIPAGTEVTAIVKASAPGHKDAFATSDFVMEKRKVLVTFEVPEESAINEKSVIEDDKLVFDREEAISFMSVEVVENGTNAEGVSSFVRESDDEIAPGALLDGDVTIDVSDIDFEEIGYQEVPVLFDEAEEMSGNYEVSFALLGSVYVGETIYTITFAAKNDGLTKELVYEIDQTKITDNYTIPNLLATLGKTSEVSSMGGILNTDRGDVITGWLAAKDAISDIGSAIYLDADFCRVDYDEPEVYNILKKSDYYLTARLSRKASENVYIEAVPAVVYDGRNHVAADASESQSQNPDLDFVVKYVADDDEVTYLRYGTDYKVTYKNNKNASLYMTNEGKYEPVYTAGADDAKRPYAVITGTGAYNGFSATVYFDILPDDLGDSPVAQISGLKNSYVLKSNGKISGSFSPKVIWNKWYYTGKKYVQKTYTLKAGTDYEPKLYIYKNDMWNECADSNPNNISEEGKYLYTVRGKGNFCGTAFGQTYTQVFNDGSDGTPNPAVCSYVGTDIRACQFIVIGDASQDLANASITVKKTQLNYKYGKFYTADDFGIKVTVGSGSDKRVLTEGVDYYVTFDGADFRYISGKNKSTGMYYSSTAYEVYSGSAGNNAKINLANKYDVTITAINGNSNGIFGSKKAKSVRIKGVTISSGWFKFKTSSLKYTGDNSSSYKYTLSRSAKVSVKSPDSVLSFKSESGTYYSSNYTDIKESMLPADTVFVMRDGENKNPGTYEMEVLPIGPGVDHDYVAKVNFKRTGITTKEAMKAGILSVTCDAADYNAGGALPKNIKVTLNGVTNNLGDLEYNGQSFYIDDYYYGMTADPTYVKITITVSNNTKTGNSAGLYITGDGKVFTGKSDKITYAVEGIDVKDITIPVLSKDSYSYEYGKLTPYIKQSDTNSFFATYEPVSKPAKGSVSPKIELYQVYCDKNGNKALAKINKSQYKLTLTENGSNRYSVVVSNTKPKMITGYDFSNVKIAEDYTVYDSTASIVGARVKVNGQEYSFPMDNSTSFTFTGSQIRFDKKAGDGVVSVTLKDGTELTPDDFTVEYGDNTAIGTGKKGGSFTITLKRNDKTATYKYGGKATFYFSISKSGTIVM